MGGEPEDTQAGEKDGIGVGGEGTGKDWITVFTSEGCHVEEGQTCCAWSHRAELEPTGLGVGVAKRQISAQYRKKFVTIRAAQPAQEAVSCSSLACASKSSKRGLGGYMHTTCEGTCIVAMMPATLYCALTVCPSFSR